MSFEEDDEYFATDRTRNNDKGIFRGVIMKKIKIGTVYSFCNYLYKGKGSIFTYLSSTSRRVHCKKCNVVIPMNIPKFYFYIAWDSYQTGHYCLKCTKNKLDEKVCDWKNDLKDLQSSLTDFKNLKETCRVEMKKRAYIDQMTLEEL